jgi:hypothetical protein
VAGVASGVGLLSRQAYVGVAPGARVPPVKVATDDGRAWYSTFRLAGRLAWAASTEGTAARRAPAALELPAELKGGPGRGERRVLWAAKGCYAITPWPLSTERGRIGEDSQGRGGDRWRRAAPSQRSRPLVMLPHRTGEWGSKRTNQVHQGT